jgi:aldehyde:ferredoxin oxidoreductase
MWFVRINMTDRTHRIEEVPAQYRLLGGRGLTSSLVCDLVPPEAHPLGPGNVLVFAPGMLTGTSAPSSGRLSVGAKSPLTGTIKESNAGTAWAGRLASLGIRALIVEGQPHRDTGPWMIRLAWDAASEQPSVEILSATEYAGQNLYDTFGSLAGRFGRQTHVAAIGVSGEYGYQNSGIAFDDMHGRPTRYAGRGGLGAVMGSKGVKCVLVNAEGAPGVPIQNGELFDVGRRKMVDALRSHAITKPKGGLNSYGTSVLINILNEAGGLPTNNFSSGRFEGAADIAGEAIFEGVKERLGKETYNHGCSPGCIIQCSNTWYDKDGQEIASCVEYESNWALGANCGINSLDDIARMVYLCNAYGLDTIEAGTTLAVAMEAGLADFGDGARAIEMVEEMGKGSPLGRLLGGGTELAARALGVMRAPVVKGQSIPAYDPRAVKGMGVTYATTTMGADHTAGYTVAPEILSVGGAVDPLSTEAKADLSRAFQATTAFIDSIGHCLFIAFAILDIASGYEGMVEEVNGVMGTAYTTDDVVPLGTEILRRERAFNEAAGFTAAHDRLPEFMTYEPLPPHNVIYDVPNEMLDQVYGSM